MSQILLVEDEEHLAEGLAFNLRNAGYGVDLATAGLPALERLRQERYDLVLLDVALPDISGVEVCGQARKAGLTLPIIMVTARDRTQDIIAGLDAGADDYLTKPFDLDVLLAKVRGALRRVVWVRATQPSAPARTMRFGEWTIDFSTFQAQHPDGRDHALSAKEVAILQLFHSRAGAVIGRETFLEEVWNLPGSLETRTVDNFISRLRQALEQNPANPRHILSIRGAGYRFVP
jgi:two-component system alkaline phosphatase synthesis response regulator PhoP